MADPVRAASTLTYRQRRRMGLVLLKPRILTPNDKRAIAIRWLAREKKQTELAGEYGVSQATIARCVQEY